MTQNPADIPEDLLGQLGFKIQHALRAFTARDRKAIKLAAENFPVSAYYEVDEMLTEMGTGEALDSVLDGKGRPTELVHTLLRAPASRMGVLTEGETARLVRGSELVGKYGRNVDRERASEILTAKLERAAGAGASGGAAEAARTKADKRGAREERSTFERMTDSTVGRQIGRTIAREVTRGLLGVLGIKSTRSRRRTTRSWF